MAVPVVESTTTSNEAVATTSFTVAMPATRPDGDVYIFWIVKDGSAAFTSVPGEWTQIDAGTDGSSIYCGLYYRVGSSEPASYTVEGANVKWAGAVIRLSGVNTSDVLNQTGTANTGSGTANFPIPQVTPDADDTLALAFAGNDSDEPDASPYPSGWDGRFAQASSPGDEASACSAYGATQTGTNGVATDAGNFVANGTDEYRTMTIAVNPSAGAAASTDNFQQVIMY